MLGVGDERSDAPVRRSDRSALPEVAAVDLRVDVLPGRPGGPDAVRVTHLPTGTSVSVDREGSTAANRAQAMAELLARLIDRP